ncbi:MAG: hypothetical protein JKX92_01990 [Porticoccaceae bacterium]|nr:hypothetical protein [Porticoccaceae bacterium]
MLKYHLTIIPLALVLSSCAPIPTTYLQFQYSDATFNATGCSAGPKDKTRFPFHGIYIDTTIDAPRIFPHTSVDYQIPEGFSAQLVSDKAIFIHQMAGAIVKDEVTLVPYNESMTGLSKATQLMIGETKIHERLLATVTRHAWFPFMFSKEDMSFGRKGTLILPDILINGVKYKGPEVLYKEVNEIKIVIINC